jgi:hypothetical protein
LELANDDRGQMQFGTEDRRSRTTLELPWGAIWCTGVIAIVVSSLSPLLTPNRRFDAAETPRLVTS